MTIDRRLTGSTYHLFANGRKGVNSDIGLDAYRATTDNRRTGIPMKTYQQFLLAGYCGSLSDTSPRSNMKSWTADRQFSSFLLPKMKSIPTFSFSAPRYQDIKISHLIHHWPESDILPSSSKADNLCFVTLLLLRRKPSSLSRPPPIL